MGRVLKLVWFINMAQVKQLDWSIFNASAYQVKPVLSWMLNWFYQHTQFAVFNLFSGMWLSKMIYVNTATEHNNPLWYVNSQFIALQQIALRSYLVPVFSEVSICPQWRKFLHTCCLKGQCISMEAVQSHIHFTGSEIITNQRFTALHTEGSCDGG